MRITLRISSDEFNQVKSMAASEIAGTENVSEFLRMMIAREWNRRRGLPKPLPKQFRTAFRRGKPKVNG